MSINIIGNVLFFLLIALSINCHAKQRPITKLQEEMLFTMRNNKKPNIVLFLTDDQDVELGSLNFMPKTLKYIRDQGAEFRHAYVTTPMCCPSRSSLLTGTYVHNHQVFTNKDNCSSSQWQATHEKRTFATYLSNAGYRTGYFGKYLNKYNGTYIPPGWREWGGLIMNSKYYNYSINMNGQKIKHGYSYDKDYYTDVIANDSITFLRNSKKQNPNKPLMLTMAFPAPHGPEDSAPQYSDLFFNISTHHTPSYDFAPNPDKQWILQVTKKMQPVHRQFTDLLMTKRLQTLQSVDDAVEQIINELKILGELDNTYIIYTSDHGYHLGQFGLIKGKSFPFEFDVRVPFLIRGPGVVPGTTLNEIVLNIDLAPTFLDMAGVVPPSYMDGHSILPLFLSPKRKKKIKWPDTFLIESSGRRETPYFDSKQQETDLLQYSLPSGENSHNNLTKMYKAATSTNDSVEGMNLVTYTYTETVTHSMDTVKDNDYDNLNVNASDSSNTHHANQNNEQENQLEDSLISIVPHSKMGRLTHKCLFDFTKLPCRPGQKWFCQMEKGRLRRHKCKFNQYAASPTNKDNKKCICFTSNGLVYKRSAVTSDSLIESPLQTAESNEIAKILPECTINKGRVNCSSNLYQDKYTWHQSRVQIEGEIHSLKQKLENLKEIKKHLKYTKPRRKTDFNPEQVNHHKPKNYKTSLKRTLNDSYKEQSEPAINIHKENSNFHRLNTKEHVKEGNAFNNPDLSNLARKLKPHRHHHVHHLPINYTNFANTNEGFNHLEDYNNSRVENNEFNSLITSTSTKLQHKPNNCYCEEDEETDLLKNDVVAQQSKEERKKIKKQKKKEEECHFERMTCFEHNNDHWKTQPKWNAGPFCFCMNANNNTYSCLRTINSTHNFLYCEFTTGLITFYNLRIDPFELQNRFHQLKPNEKIYLKALLKRMIACKGNNCALHIDTSKIHLHF